MYPSPLRRLAGAASLLLAGLSASPAAAQDAPYSIRGTVVDATSQRPLAGVAVTLRNTQNRTVTDASGRYNLSARVAAGTHTLQYSLLGRGTGTRQVTLGAELAVEVAPVTLSESAVELEGLVVTGTGAPTERRELGTTVATVSSERITEAGATNIGAALQGKIAGAQIMSDAGTPGGGVSVRLRGTSSITGGAEPLYIIDGVIVDNSSDDIGINFGSRSNPTSRLADLNPNDIERIEVLKGAAAGALYGSRANNGVIQIFTKRGRGNGVNITAGTRATRGDRPRSIGLNLYPFNAAGQPVERFNNEELIFRDALSTDSYVSLSGGNEQTRVFLSAGYTDEQGILRGSDHEKISARLNVDQQLSSWLRLSGGANYITSHTNLLVNGEQGTGGILTALVFTPTTVDFSAKDPETGLYVNRGTAFPNPLEVVDTWSSPQDVSRFVGSFSATASPGRRVSLEYRLGYDTYSMETRLYIPRGTPVDLDGGTQGQIRDQYLINNDLVGSYILDAGRALRFTTTAGMNHTYTRTEGLSVSASDLTPFTELVRGAIQSASQNRFESVTLGFFGQEQLAWNDRLFLTGALRWDASSTFGEAERWQLYPKLSGSYVLSEEGFFEESPLGDFFTNFRLRAALGYAGNQPRTGQAFARFPLYTGVTAVNRLGLVHELNAGNPDLRPERQREVEGGFDVSFLNDRIGASFTYYNQYITDLLLDRPFAPSSGYNQTLANVGEMSNRGVELQLNTINVDRRNFRWNSTINYSRNRNRVEKLASGAFTDPGSYINYVAEGEPLGVFRTFDYARDAQGNIIYTAAGLPTRAAAVSIVGDPNPDWQGSFLNEFQLGGRLRASVLLDGVFGHDIWNQTARIMDNALRGNSSLVERELRKELPAGFANAKAAIAGAYVEDGSYLKLREVALRYEIPTGLSRRVGAAAVELELTGRNLHTWTDYSGYDPEINMFGTATVARGTDFAVYPNPRTVSVGVRLNY